MGTVAGGPSSRGGTRGGTRAGGIREGKGERGGRRTGPCSAQRPTRPLAPLPRRRSDSPVPFPRRPTTPAGAPLPPRQPLSEAPGPHSSPAGLQLTPTAPNTPRKDARRGGGGSLPEGQASRAARRPLCLPALPVRNAESGQRGRRREGTRAARPWAAWAPVIPRGRGDQIGIPYRLRGSAVDDASFDLFYENVTEEK